MKKLLKYLKPYWYIAIFSPICMILEVLVDLSLPTIMSTIVNDSLYASSIEEGLAVVAKNGVLMICLVVIGGLTGLGAAGFASAASQSFGNDLRRDAFSPFDINIIDKKVETATRTCARIAVFLSE